MILAGLTITDNTQAFAADLREELCKRLQLSADVLVREMRTEVNEPQPPSFPYEPPHRDTSLLYLSIDNEPVDKQNLTVLVGVPSSQIAKGPYPLYLELGTSKMLPRPWLRPALAKTSPMIRQIMLAALPHASAKRYTNTAGIIRYKLGFGF